MKKYYLRDILETDEARFLFKICHFHNITLEQTGYKNKSNSILKGLVIDRNKAEEILNRLRMYESVWRDDLKSVLDKLSRKFMLEKEEIR